MTQSALVAERGPNQPATGHKVIGGVAVGLRVTDQAAARDEVVGGLGYRTAHRGGNEDDGCSGLDEIFHGISLGVVGRKQD